MKPQISIIMPVYNTGNILYDTIQSVLNQTFDDFELILVNDGSTDKSGDICNYFANLDHRVVVVHKENGGICSARNAGIDISRGDYITFCDHDDLYMPTILQKEFEIVQKRNADMVIVGKITEKNGVKIQSNYEFDYDYFQLKKDILNIIKGDSLHCIWNILYKRQLIDQYRFNTKYKRGHEDFIFNLNMLDRVNIVCAINEPLYVHIVRDNLSTSAKIYKDAIPAMIETCNKVYEIIMTLDILKYDIRKKAIEVLSREIRNCLAYSVKAGVSYNEFVNIINNLQYIPESNIFRINDVDLKTKVTYFLLSAKKIKLLYILLSLNKKIK